MITILISPFCNSSAVRATDTSLCEKIDLDPSFQNIEKLNISKFVDTSLREMDDEQVFTFLTEQPVPDSPLFEI